MKNILITGTNSYIGNSLEKWLENYPSSYKVEKISLRDGSWKEKDLSKFDSLVHVAGIAHVSKDTKMEDLYYRVNRDLTVEVAEKAKKDKVKQFIFLSSIIVYGDGVGKDGVIDKNTIPKPRDFYGDSKLQAEKEILQLENEDFKIAIIRPPMIYGKGSKGNYPKLSKLARTIPLFPDIENKRSMLHIDNLCEFLRLIVENEESGLFFPQNEEYVKTSEIVRMIAEIHGKDIRLVKLFNPLLYLIRSRIGILNKVFGNLFYDLKISQYSQNYRINDIKESILKSEV